MITQIVRALGEVLFPPLCACCGSVMVDGEQTICTICRYDMPLTYYFNRKENFVVDLMAGRACFDNASALMFFHRHTDYQRLIHRMKYGGRDDIARALGEIYGRFLSQSGLYADLELVVAVPLHWTKMFKRGYNQSLEFAIGVGRSMGIPVENRAVRRVKRTRTQANIGDPQSRVRNVQGAFAVVGARFLEGRNILLLDDVITTGATLESCADAINRSVPTARLNLGAIAIVRDV